MDFYYNITSWMIKSKFPTSHIPSNDTIFIFTGIYRYNLLNSTIGDMFSKSSLIMMRIGLCKIKLQWFFKSISILNLNFSGQPYKCSTKKNYDSRVYSMQFSSQCDSIISIAVRFKDWPMRWTYLPHRKRMTFKQLVLICRNYIWLHLNLRT